MLDIVVKMFRRVPTNKSETLIRQVVESSLAEVAQRVAGRVDDMSQSEARGYVRARSSAVVLRQVRVALKRQANFAPELTAAVASAATERLIPQVLRQASAGVSRRMAPPLAA
jgi:hypothetical protein